MKKITLFIFVSLFISQKSTATTVFKCKNKSGAIIFSDSACQSNQHVKKIYRFKKMKRAEINNKTQKLISHPRPYKKRVTGTFEPNLHKVRELNTLKRERTAIIADLDRRTLPYGVTKAQLLARLRVVEQKIKQIEDEIISYNQSTKSKDHISFGK